MSDAITKPETKSWVQQFVERARGEIQKAPPASATSYVRETGSTIGDYLEGGAVASLLGATHAKWGLDTKGGPIDGWLAGLGALASVGFSGHSPGLADHARRIGAQAFGIFAFRKAFEVVKHEPLAGGGSVAQRVTIPGKGPGASGEDPIEVVAKGLDGGAAP
jgi:hypothetical protein